MDLKKVSQLTGLPLRRLRYVVDHGIAPNSSVAIRGIARAQPRQFAESTAFLVALGAAMLEAGVKSELARVTVEAVSDCQWKRTSRSHQVFADSILNDGLAGTVEIADSQFMKFTITRPAWTSGWLDIATLMPSDLDEPHRIVIRVDVGNIAKLISQA